MIENRPRRRLERSTDDKVIAGVCGGLARYFDVDAVLVRIVIAALIVFGGFGALVYIAAWLLVPEQGAQRSIVGVGDASPSLRVVGIVVLAIVSLGTAFSWGSVGWGFGGDGWPVVVLLIAAGVVVYFVRESQAPARSTTAVAPGAEAAGAAGTADAHGGADAPAGADETGAGAEPVWDDEQRPAPPRGSWVVTAIASGSVLLLVGIAGVLDATGTVALGWGGVAAIAIVLTGAALVASSFFGGARGLIPVGIVLAVVLGSAAAAGLSLNGGVGERDYRVTDGDELRGRYELGVGRLRVDVRDIALARGTTRVDADVDVGMLEIVADDGQMIGGESDWEGGGEGDSGIDVDRTIVVGSGDRRLEIDAHVGIGVVVVRRRPGDDNWSLTGSAPRPRERACGTARIALVRPACEGGGDDA